MAQAARATVHHPIDEDILLQYASGALTGAKALMVATHLAMCPSSRKLVADAEGVAAELFFAMSEPEPVEGASLSVLPDPDPATFQPANVNDIALCPVPQPLRGVLGGPLQSLAWRNIWFGVRELAVPADKAGEAFTMLLIPPGRRMPRHDHEGEEWTMVLQGAYRDASGRYGPGDLQRGYPGLDHQPQAELGVPCLCMVVSDAPLKLTGLTGRLVNLPRYFGVNAAALPKR